MCTDRRRFEEHISQETIQDHPDIENSADVEGHRNGVQNGYLVTCLID